MSFKKAVGVKDSGFNVPRFTDAGLFERLNALTQSSGFAVDSWRVNFTFSDTFIDFTGSPKGDELQEFLSTDAVSIREAHFMLSGGVRLRVERPGKDGLVTGNQDRLWVGPHNGPNQPPVFMAKFIALARKHFDAIDAKPFLEYLEDSTRQVYEAREQDLQKLERMQESFFSEMIEFTKKQQTEQESYRRRLDEEYASRQVKLEAEHQERLRQYEAKEDALRKVRAAIDERENRQARRDIYAELKDKLAARNQQFELTKGTQARRRVVFGFTTILMALLAVGFAYCFYKNVVAFESAAAVNWVAISSQIGFALALAGVATFFIRWNHHWSQLHADEEFRLKRLDLDIDRANWLVELAMEWNNITKAEIPAALVQTLARNLFADSGDSPIDIHPAETLMAALLGKSGTVDLDLPTKVKLQRSESSDRE